MKHIDALTLIPDEFSKLQREDKILSKYWRLAEISDKIYNNDKVQLKIKNDVLYREYQSGPHHDVIEQVVVPECLRKILFYMHMKPHYLDIWVFKLRLKS